MKIGNNVNINNNFRYNNNFAYRPNYWGARPWWGAGNYHRWHHGHWGYGWNAHYHHRHWYYRDNSFARGFIWDIAVWSLGNMIYDMGYQSYRNPYSAPPVQNTYVTYTKPVSVVAAANPPGDEAKSASAEEKSAEALEKSRAAFKTEDYVTALKLADEALTHTPGDTTLHEYRALVFFALGKYADAAGVLNPVLASGPGWGWDTMVAFYNDSESYKAQLAKLEEYTKSTNKGDGHFLLGYHYLVCGYMEESNAEFAKAAELEPNDSISAQLRDLTANSIDTEGQEEPEPEERPDPVPADKLVGSWTSENETGKVTFEMKESGDFTWKFAPKSGDSSEFSGTYGLDEQGLLVMTSDDTQMVSVVEMKEPDQLHFALVGAPDGGPGLDFSKG
ncbi:MAG: tetratricopeptide repeat protein [Akkermansiaceae bacterium]